ncbi:MAG TPA: hypothetical protein VGM56_28295 [Byssovorax sp.]|jgi:hypothetical protein
MSERAPRLLVGGRGRWALVALAVAAALETSASCGARSGLDAPGAGGGGGASTAPSSTSTILADQSSSSSLMTCTTAAECDDGVPCTIDACTNGVCAHTPDDAACDDGLSCTKDTCDPTSGCDNSEDDSLCDDGIACTADRCDLTIDACMHEPCDDLCDDGVFCNGVERCDELLGCTHGAPACLLGLDCSTDRCVESIQQCGHAATAGCTPDVKLLVTEADGQLRSVDPYTGEATLVAEVGEQGPHLDIAVLEGRWFAVDANRLLELVPQSNAVSRTMQVPYANSLGAGPDGKLYAADFDVYRLDPDTGASTTIGALPSGYESSGDIAYFQGDLYISVDGPCGGALVSLDLDSGASQVIGGDGLGCVYGLAATADTLFVLNCDGKIGSFDPVAGVATVLSTADVTVYGADILPP